jgi:WhiB family redox-sensing transcriptional regulator
VTPLEILTAAFLREALELEERAEPWKRDALCRERGDVNFFPTRGRNVELEEARRVCRRCAVQAECLEYALAHRVSFGVWGATSERQRHALRLQSPR